MATHSSSCLENPMDRDLASYSPEGHKESDTLEQLNMHAGMHILYTYSD